MEKHEEKGQRKYTEKTLLSEQKNKTPARALGDNATLYKDVTDFMGEKGVSIGYEKTYDRCDGYRDKNNTRSESYHVDGVSVGVLRIKEVEEAHYDRNKGKQGQWVTTKKQSLTQIRFASNDGESLDSLVEVIRDRFPSFEETDDILYTYRG